MGSYHRPLVIATFSIAELCADAAACSAYKTRSHRNLKTAIETIDEPLSKLGSINTV